MGQCVGAIALMVIGMAALIVGAKIARKKRRVPGVITIIITVGCISLIGGSFWFLFIPVQ